jgi:outer membrane protein TolC
MKKLTTIFFVFLSTISVLPQTKLSLEECYLKARENYPLIKQKAYIEQSKDYSVSNVWKGYLPQVTISGQATYQSDVTSIPISFPGLKIDQLAKDQYKVVAEVTQTVYDGGIMATQADIQRVSAEADDQKIEIELLKVKDRINQIYFGILLYDKQITQTQLVKKDVEANLSKLTAALKNGTATQPNVDVMKAELLKTNQKEIELKASRKSFVQMLGLLINVPLEETVELSQPNESLVSETEEIRRPEMKLYSFQQKMINEQSGLTLAKILPKASLFFQGGYGKPTLNMLKNNFDWYYTAGARLTWAVSNIYTYGNENEINELNQKSVEAQKEAFLLNTNLSLKQQSGEIEKLKKLIEVDKQIIEIRTSVKIAAQSQLDNGVITSSDYVRELNAEDQAKENLSIHTIQLLLAQQNYSLTKGN